jgi:hypothetical protein
MGGLALTAQMGVAGRRLALVNAGAGSRIGNVLREFYLWNYLVYGSGGGRCGAGASFYNSVQYALLIRKCSV